MKKKRDVNHCTIIVFPASKKKQTSWLDMARREELDPSLEQTLTKHPGNPLPFLFRPFFPWFMAPSAPSAPSEWYRQGS